MKTQFAMLALAASIISTPAMSADTLFEYYKTTARAKVDGVGKSEWESTTYREATPIHQSYNLSASGNGATSSMRYDLDYSPYDNGAVLRYSIDGEIQRDEESRASVDLGHGGAVNHKFRATNSGLLKVNFNIDTLLVDCPERAVCMSVDGEVTVTGNGYRETIKFTPKNGFKDGVSYLEIPVQEGKDYLVQFSSGNGTSGGSKTQSITAVYTVTWEAQYD
ncbi:conserved hypothetical protein [Hahella chejuensis KCTC 2396]|uniref:Uncharacterized protein n=1 Tax=Hahella chejuensis (strain KCTC 2396) TaxID=349521 RepID=Q2SAR6_HAHCH|nr:hypothetical protein [Hahella chejuensis]ABC32258.1 conserved hypothetical protein [Hahella chejuensis KCTC 2396]